MSERPGRRDLAPVVDIRGAGKVYGDQRALDDVDLTVGAGTIVGVIGPSGCGKTTLVRLLTGITRPTEGVVEVFGEDPTRLSAAQRTRFGYMPQLPVLFPNLTVWGNLNFIASMYGMRVRGRRWKLRHLLELVGLDEHRSKKLSECSGGMQRRLALAATLVHDPELLYLDEPTAGVDPVLRARFWDHFRDLRDEGRTIIVPTQYVGEAVSCDHVAVMSDGKLLVVATPTELPRYAYGGDPIGVALEGWLANADIERIRSAPFVRSVRRSEHGLLVIVDEAERDLLPLQQVLSSLGSSATVAPVEASYDDMFVEIMERHTAANAAQPAA